MIPGRTARALIVLSIGFSPAATAAPQDDAAPGGAVVVDGVAISGPAPPALPETLARDAQGRVTIRAVRLAEPLQIDGRLDEAIYATIRPASGFIQVNPTPGAPATEDTEAWIFFDGDTLYVAARCWDSAPEDRWVANEMRRDRTSSATRTLRSTSIRSSIGETRSCSRSRRSAASTTRTSPTSGPAATSTGIRSGSAPSAGSRAGGRRSWRSRSARCATGRAVRRSGA